MQPLSRSLLCLPVFFVLLLNIPQNKADRIRSFLPWPKKTKKEVISERLELENKQLRSQLEIAYELLGGEKRIKEEIDLFRHIDGDLSMAKTKREVALKRLRYEAIAIQASVIYRDPASWSSSFWIDVGTDLGSFVLNKNSPVIAAGNLVGVIEYVGKHQSRVRLITDSGLKVAVRAARGGVQERELAVSAKCLLEQIKKHPKWQNTEFALKLADWEASLAVRSTDFLLAKGEIRGSSAPIFRSLHPCLQGSGFNYEFSDEDGERRDLRSSIIQEGDLLITSGLDGVFPKGIPVAFVSKVKPLREGAFFYELEANALSYDLMDLKSVFVLPPLPTE